MIVNIHQKNSNLVFGNVPDLFFQNHEVCVMNIFAKLNQPLENGLVTLTSTMVDKSSTNPKQELVSFYNSSFFDITYDRISYQPTHLVWYKLQCQYVGDSVFELQLEKPHKTGVFGREKYSLDEIYIQLQFREICKDSARQ